MGDERNYPSVVAKTRQELEKIDDNIREIEVRLLSRYSHLPLAHKYQQIKLKSFRKVVQEETGLMGDLSEHARARARLQFIDVEIQTDLLERENRLQVERERQDEQEVRRMLREVERLQAKKEALKLQMEIGGMVNPPQPQSPVDKLREDLEAIRLKEQLQAEHRREKMINSVMGSMVLQEDKEDMFKELERRILKGKHYTEATPEELDQLKEAREKLEELIHRSGVKI